MPNLTSVGVTAGVPTSGTGTVSTIDGLISTGLTVNQGTSPWVTSVSSVTGLAQGSTTSGETGDLVMGAVTTSAPSYTTAQTSPLSLDTSGNLRTSIAGALGTGSNIIGKVTTDQTTPGTTDLVHSAQSGTWTVQPGNTANTTAWKVDGSAVTQPVSLTSTTVTGTVAVTESGTWTVQPGNTVNTSPWLVQLGDVTTTAPITGNGSGTLTATGNLFSLDTSGYGCIAVQVTSAGTTCTITYEQSNDNSTWVNAVGINSTTLTPTSVSTSTTAVGFAFVLTMRYFRARVSTYTSGTVTAFYALRTNPPSNYNLASTTVSSGTVNVSSSAVGGYSFNHITTDTTTTVKSGSGTLHSIVINTLAATGTATVYDNTAGSGTVIAVIGTGTAMTLIYDVAFATGLTIVTATAAADITVTYK